jgi:ABC-type Fe3+-hydroxamate transport system substrate-binding protein
MPQVEDNRRRLRTIVGLIGLLVLSACSGRNNPSDPAALTVSVGMYGGPLNATTGRQAETGAPMPNQAATVTDSTGRTVTATTNSTGVATMQLAPGRYFVTSGACGPGSAAQPVTLLAHASVHYQVACSIP